MSIKEEIISKIINLVDTTTKDMVDNNKLEHLKYVTGVDSNEINSIISYIVNFLPKKLFLDKNENIRDYTIIRISQDIILFLAQEDIKSKYFKNNLDNFKNEIINHVNNEVFIKD